MDADEFGTSEYSVNKNKHVNDVAAHSKRVRAAFMPHDSESESVPEERQIKREYSKPDSSTVDGSAFVNMC